MFTTPLPRRVLPVLLATAAIGLGAPGIAHAATPHPPAAPQHRSAPDDRQPALVKQAARLLERRDPDAPAVTA